MLTYVFDFLTYVSLFLHLLLLIFLVRGGAFRKYSVIVAYCLVQLATTMLEFGAYSRYGNKSSFYRNLYWTDEIILNLLLFLMVIMLTYKALGESPMRSAAGKLLGGVFIAVVLLPFLIFHPVSWTTKWFNHTSQLLSFGGAIMNLALWTALLSNRKRDPQLLTVSAGLGILVTGAAISFGVRSYIGLDYRWLPNLFMSTTHVICMVIWCWAFRLAPKPPSGAPGNAVASFL